MVWLSVIVMGFLLLGRLAQTLLARCFEGGGPPCQLIEHLPGGLIEMLEFAQRLAVFDHGQVIGKQDVNGAADRRHLQLNGVEAQLFYRASAANAAVAYESDRLVHPFSVGVVERILQNRSRSAIVFGCREDKGVEFADFLLPSAGQPHFSTEHRAAKPPPRTAAWGNPSNRSIRLRNQSGAWRSLRSIARHDRRSDWIGCFRSRCQASVCSWRFSLGCT